MEDINRLFSDLKQTVDRFYQQNADLDASGVIQFEPVLKATKKLDLYLMGDFKSLWRIECEDAKKFHDEMEEMLEFKTQDIICSVGDEIMSLRRELTIMTRCAKRMMENYQKECIDHEATKFSVAKIDAQPPHRYQHKQPCPSPSASVSSTQRRIRRRTMS